MKPFVLLTRTLATAAPVLAGALMLGASAPAPQAPAADTVLPGYWEYTTSALGMGDTETKCVRPSEINRFFGGLSTRRWQCTYPVREVGNISEPPSVGIQIKKKARSRDRAFCLCR